MKNYLPTKSELELAARQAFNLASDLWPLDRSITGDGNRQSLARIQSYIGELDIHEAQSGKQVFDWTIPKEWRVHEAYIIGPDGDMVCDFRENNLHLVGYSSPFRGCLSLDQLDQHLFSLPEQAEAIPYVTSYYNEGNWGFCIADSLRKQLQQGSYQVVVNTELFDGSLTYGELYLPGQSSDEIFFSTYICHPSMANNELSGPVIAATLARILRNDNFRRFSFRFAFVPETIGSINYISDRLSYLKENVKAAFNVTCVGDDRNYSFLPSRLGGTLADRVAEHVLKHAKPDYSRYQWKDRGSDERQYCWPGIDLPMVSIMRTKYGEYPEYHTSLDKLGSVVSAEGLKGSLDVYLKVLSALENNETLHAAVYCEPQLGKRGLYPNISSPESSTSDAQLLLDILSYSDGDNDLLEIAEYLDMPIWNLYDSIDILKDHSLITN